MQVARVRRRALQRFSVLFRVRPSARRSRVRSRRSLSAAPAPESCLLRAREARLLFRGVVLARPLWRLEIGAAVVILVEIASVLIGIMVGVARVRVLRRGQRGRKLRRGGSLTMG